MKQKTTYPKVDEVISTQGCESQNIIDVNQPTKDSINTFIENKQDINVEGQLKFAHFAQFAQFASQQKESEEKLANSSTIPDEVYNNLPDILKKGSSVFSDQREKDVFLTGALGVLSGLFSMVKGLYSSDETFSNLNCFIVAPPSSGKGVMKYAKILGKSIHTARINNTNSEFATPGFQYLLYIPANSSSSVVIRHLDENSESGIVFETEADTLSDTLKQDWGGYSDLIRKAFHHETISYSRKKDREFIELNQPKLSIILSGTPDQVKNLIHSTENGLFSRIIFYAFEGKNVWRSVAPGANRLNFNTYFEDLGREVKTIHDAYISKSFKFDLTPEQWDVLDYQCGEWLQEITTFIHMDTASIAIRLGIIHFRIAMILSILRHYQEGHIEDSNIVCSDRDFKTAQLLSNIYLEHGLNMFFKLPGESKKALNTYIKRFYDQIPKDVLFTRAAAVKLGFDIGIQERAVGKYLKKLVEINYLNQPEYGKYKKP